MRPDSIRLISEEVRARASELYSGGLKLVSLIPFVALLVPVVFGFPIPVPLRLVPSHLVFTVMVLQPFYPDSLLSFLKDISKKY